MEPPAASKFDLQNGVRPGGVGVGAVLAGDAHCRALGHGGHELAGVRHLLEGEADDVDVLLGVLAGLQLLPAVEQVEELAAVDLVEGDVDVEGGVALVSQQEDVLSAEVVHAEHSVLGVPVHRVRLARPSLPVREAGHLGPLEGALHHRPHALPVHLDMTQRTSWLLLWSSRA